MKHKLLSIILSVSLIATLCNTSMVFASSEIMLSDDVALLSLEQTPNLQKKETKKGGQVKYEKVTYTKHQAGQVFHTYKYKVTDLGAY